MLKKIALALMGLSTTLAWAEESYQVAYSKKEDLVIIADNATESNWCKKDLSLRFQAGANASEDGLKALFPKLGSLFEQLCPQAETLAWSYVDAQNRVALKGNTDKGREWAFAVEAAAPSAAEALAQEEDEVAKVEDAAVSESEAPAVAETTEAAATEETKVTEAVKEPTAEADKSAETVAAETAAEPAPVQEATSESMMQSFAVAGWQPISEEERQKILANFQTKENQDGCKMMSFFDFKEQEQYIQFKTRDIACDQNGYLNGTGTLIVERTDGKVLYEKKSFVFKHGLPFEFETKITGPQELQLFKTSKDLFQEHRRLYFGIGSSKELNAHYFLTARFKDQAGFGMFEPEGFGLILTDRMEDFRKTDTIQKQLDTAIEFYQQRSHGQFYGLRLSFVDGLEKGLDDNTLEEKLYFIEYGRERRYGKKFAEVYAAGPWKKSTIFDPRNQLFEREKRLAEEKEREERRIQQEKEWEERRIREAKEREERRIRQEKGYEAQKQFAEYRKLEALDWSTPDNVQANIYENIDVGSDEYLGMLKGNPATLSSLVRVDAVKDGKAQVVWPYSMTLSLPLEKGWYWIKGEQVFSPTESDKDGLALTEVTLKEEDVFKCAQDMCADLQDPQTIARIRFGLPDWTAEEAQRLIKDANRY